MDFFRSFLTWFSGVLFLVLFFPVSLVTWLVLLPTGRSSDAVHRLLIFQAHVLVHLLPLRRLVISGLEKAESNKTYVIISNHQSSLDTVVLYCLKLRFTWISKIENSRVPVVGWYLRMAGYLTVHRGNEESKAEMLAKAVGVLKEGTSIMIFPEGTRSADREIGFFRRGAFLMAIEAKVPVLPVVIDGTGDILPKKGFIARRGHNVTMKVLDPVPYESFGTPDPDLLALRFGELMKEELRKIRHKNNVEN